MTLRSFPIALVLALFALPLHAQSNVKTISLTFTTIDVPGASVVSVNGINTAGDMVGWYANSTSGPYHSFLLVDGNLSFFDFPGAVSTAAQGINDSGLIVGFEGDFYDKGFAYDGSGFTAIRAGQGTRTFIYAINNDGDMVGGAGSPYTTKAFLLRAGVSKVVKFPGSYVYAYATGINSVGQIVGWTDSSSYSYKRGIFTSVNVPSADRTLAFSINDKPIIVGCYATGANYYGFALKQGKYFSFGYPGAAATCAYGINNNGLVVGEYSFDYVTWYGFVTSPIGSADVE